jgi:NAD(P)-dependent dehydrogenase (short-subunit alcohol dehydrogenase family)
VDLTRPEMIASALAGIDEFDSLVVTAIHQPGGNIHAFSVADAVLSATVKLVGYAEAVRALRDRFAVGGSVVLFGGSAKDRPYPGSTMVTAINGGVSSLVRTLAWELAPVRVNALHPGVVLDSPIWQQVPDDLPPRTLTGSPIAMADIVSAADFLLNNQAVNVPRPARRRWSPLDGQPASAAGSQPLSARPSHQPRCFTVDPRMVTVCHDVETPPAADDGTHLTCPSNPSFEAWQITGPQLAVEGDMWTVAVERTSALRPISRSTTTMS